MNLPWHFGYWDLLLLVAVSLQGTALAYVRAPKWKALFLCLPVPFTVAALALGAPIGATHVVGMLLLMLYTHAVRILHVNLRLPIILSIAASAGGYAAIGAVIARVLPITETSFWVCSGVVFLVSLAVFLCMPHRMEPGHRTPLGVWVKLPIIAGVVLFLILTKKALQGFMPMFPMVGIIAAYELRHSLWTVSRQIPAFMLCMAPTLVVIHLLQQRFGLGIALVAGWVVFLTALTPFLRSIWDMAATTETGQGPEA